MATGSRLSSRTVTSVRILPEGSHVPEPGPRRSRSMRAMARAVTGICGPVLADTVGSPMSPRCGSARRIITPTNAPGRLFRLIPTTSPQDLRRPCPTLRILVRPCYSCLDGLRKSSRELMGPAGGPTLRWSAAERRLRAYQQGDGTCGSVRARCRPSRSRCRCDRFHGGPR
jgi:hypothetical protein